MERALSFGRAMLSLARAAARGTVEVIGRARSARISVREGRVTAATGAEHALGDMLALCGEMDWRAHREALAQGAPAGLVGRWLITQGVASRDSVQRALHLQLHTRLEELFSWEQLDYRFASAMPQEHDGQLPAYAIGLPDVVLRGICRLLSEQDEVQLRKALGGAPFRLSSSGSHIVRGATLLDEERQAVEELQRGASSDLRQLGGRALRTAVAIKLLGGLEPATKGSQRYSLLLRKKRQLRRAAGPASLLELPSGSSPEAARRALRRLACKLHPDRLGVAAPRPLRVASTEVMAALSQAEYSLRSDANTGT
ncbi:MAG: hypothetical protein MJD61_10900 [Proteobacteria bacterium]|nr:hypothetical protein [Pseudomonadota bacterium]